MITHGTPQGWPEVPRSYSIVVASETIVATSGQLGMNPLTGTLVEGGLAAEVAQALSNIDDALRAGGSSLANALKVNVYLADLRRDYADFDRIYREIMPEPRPARTTLGATLPNGLIEIEALGIRVTTSDEQTPSAQQGTAS